jgi:DNA-binding NarL/FixJ family response regulator
MVRAVRVLLADDSMIVRMGLRTLLETRGDFEVCAEANNGHDAVRLAVQHLPDVVILGDPLSVIDGIEATRQIRKEAKTPEIMIFTLQDEDDDIRAALRAGARGYVFKSETDAQIIRAVDALAKHRDYVSIVSPDPLFRNLSIGDWGGGEPVLLTARERDVVRLVAEGKSNKIAAHLLRISTKTIEAHRAAAMRKLNVHSTAQLVRYAVRLGLVDA